MSDSNDTVTVHYQGPGAGISKEIPVDELSEYGDQWKTSGEIGGNDVSGYTAEELSAHVDELIPEEKEGDTVLDLSAPGEEGRELQIDPFVTDDSRLKRMGFSSNEIEELKEAQKAENQRKKEQGLRADTSPSKKSWSEIKDEAREEWSEMQKEKREGRQDMGSLLRLTSKNYSRSSALFNSLADDVENGEFDGNEAPSLPGEEIGDEFSELDDEAREAAISAFEDYTEEEGGSKVFAELADELREELESDSPEEEELESDSNSEGWDYSATCENTIIEPNGEENTVMEEFSDDSVVIHSSNPQIKMEMRDYAAEKQDGEMIEDDGDTVSVRFTDTTLFE